MRSETSAGGIVFKKTSNQKPVTSNSLWLICQHSQHKGWVFPKGIVGDKNQDEPLEDAALREVEEEGGVKAKILNKLPKPVEYVYTFNNEKIKKTVHYFLMEYISGDPNNHDFEMMDAKFASEEEVRKTLTYQTDKEAFEMVRRTLEGIED